LDLGASEEELGDFCVAISGCIYKSSVSVSVLLVDLDLGASEEELGGICPTFAGCPHKGSISL